MWNKMIMLISLLFLMTLVGCNNTDTNETREVSSTFSLPVTFGDGTKGEAVEEKIIANKVNKYMWHFWGNKDSISGDFKVVGTDKEGKKHPVLVSGNETVWQYSNTSISPNNGADSHIPSNMLFPTSGLWKLEIYFNDKLFDGIVINVKDS